MRKLCENVFLLSVAKQHQLLFFFVSSFIYPLVTVLFFRLYDDKDQACTRKVHQIDLDFRLSTVFVSFA